MFVFHNPKNPFWNTAPFFLDLATDILDDGRTESERNHVKKLKLSTNDAKKQSSERKEDTEEEIPTYLIPINVSGDTESLKLSTDLPGVKAKDISVTESLGTLTIEATRNKKSNKSSAKFTRRFELDKTIVDPSKAKASVEDGVLTVTIQKRSESVPITIQPALNDAPEEGERATAGSFHFELEIPGVKPSDLTVTVTPATGKISILAKRAKRKHDGLASVVKRNFVVDESKVDVSKLEAYHSHGILTLVAPKKETTAAYVRSIPVNDGPPVAAKAAGTEKEGSGGGVIVEEQGTE